MPARPPVRLSHPSALLAAALTFAACRPEATPPPARPSAPPATAPTSQPAPPPDKRAPARVTILYTSDEHGWLYGQGEGPKLRGGAAEALARWITDDAHCPLRAPDPTAGEPCKDPATLLLSGGDNFTGPAVSTYFRGLPMAQAMARMGYVASAFGNHDYDFERPAFDANRAASGVRYLAANIRAKDPAKDPGFPPFLLVERRRLRIGIVGLATEKTPQEAAPSRFEGLAFDPPGPALDRAVTAAYAAGADTVVLLAHACEDEAHPHPRSAPRVAPLLRRPRPPPPPREQADRRRPGPHARLAPRRLRPRRSRHRPQPPRARPRHLHRSLPHQHPPPRRPLPRPRRRLPPRLRPQGSRRRPRRRHRLLRHRHGRRQRGHGPLAHPRPPRANRRRHRPHQLDRNPRLPPSRPHP
ncbi:MAG: hypothetical protein R3F14_09400 [Polyangiaceae bacterium]